MKRPFKFENIEPYFVDLMSERRRDRFSRLLLCLLFVASRFYRAVNQFRVWLYDKRVIRNHALGCLVVSIGNLSCGGTGKTPVVEVFAKTLSSKGRKVAILSRGYRSKKRSQWSKLRHFFGQQEMSLPPHSKCSKSTATVWTKWIYASSKSSSATSAAVRWG